jgi:hypothetical protein
MVDPGVSAWFESKKARSASITADQPDGAPGGAAAGAAGVAAEAEAGMAGAAGSLPDAKSSPHTSQNTSSGVRVAPQFGHTDRGDPAPDDHDGDDVGEDGAPDGVAGAAVADPGAGLNAAPQLSQ